MEQPALGNACNKVSPHDVGSGGIHKVPVVDTLGMGQVKVEHFRGPGTVLTDQDKQREQSVLMDARGQQFRYVRHRERGIAPCQFAQRRNRKPDEAVACAVIAYARLKSP